MSIMNRASDGSAPILLVLWRALRTMRAIPKDTLLALCAPDSLGDEEGRARKTLKRWLQLGLFTESDGKLHLNSPFNRLEPSADPEYWEFRHEVRRLLFRPEANHDFLKPEPSGAADFTFACAWLLSTDVYGSHFESAESIQALEGAQIERIDGAKKFVIQNPTRWDGFRDWATFVGFGWNIPPFQLDPTEAVEFEIADLFQGQKSAGINTVVKHVGDRIPVLDEGTFATSVRERATSGWRPIERHEVSPALSRALLRLEESGRIKLVDRSDADRRTLLGRGFREFRRVSHVEVARGWS
ncbi:MAG: protein DpdG [Enhygromyxa sp.]